MVIFDVGRDRKEHRDSSSSKIDDEENYALVGKENKGKGNVSHSKSDSFHGGKKNSCRKSSDFIIMS